MRITPIDWSVQTKLGDSAEIAILRAALTIRVQMRVQQVWETATDLAAAFEQAGVMISSDQLRRWRDQGLMPRVEQVGLGRAAGSVVRYHPGTAQLAINIHRLLAVKKKLSFVGWQLWMQGYEVADEYWKPLIVSASQDLKRIPAWIRLMERQNRNDAETIYDQVPASLFQETPFAKGLAKLSPDMRAFAFGFLAEVALGRLEHPEAGNQSEHKSNRQKISQFVGVSSNSNVAGLFSNDEFALALENQLSIISLTLGEIQKSPIAQICEIDPSARIEFATVLELAAQLNSAIPGLAKSSIGRFATALSTDLTTQAHALIIWNIFSHKGSILGISEIVEMLDKIKEN